MTRVRNDQFDAANVFTAFNQPIRWNWIGRTIH